MSLSDNLSAQGLVPAVNSANISSSSLRSVARVPWGTWGLRIAALSYFAVLILVPLLVIYVEGFRNGLDPFRVSMTRPSALSAIGLTVWTAAVMAVINTFMGTLTAYILVTYRFPLKGLFNALIDL